MSTLRQHQLFHRAELQLGKDVMARIHSKRVIIFGVGGVGSWCSEALIRTGISRLTIVDSDLICATNVNRQLQATSRNIGLPKVDELRKRLLEINPEAEITAVKAFYDQHTCEQFQLTQYDYVLDAIDTLKNKILLLRRCLEGGVRVFSSMGAGAKLDPTQIRTARISKTKHCPLARMVRKRLRQNDVNGEFLCVYSEELPMDDQGEAPGGSKDPLLDDAVNDLSAAGKARVNGTLAHVTAPFGFALAGLVIQDIAAESRPPPSG